MSTTRPSSRKGDAISPVSSGPGRPATMRKGRVLLNRAKAGTVRVARVTHAAWEAVGASATSLLGQPATRRLFNPGLLDRLHPPLTWRREC